MINNVNNKNKKSKLSKIAFLTLIFSLLLIIIGIICIYISDNNKQKEANTNINLTISSQLWKDFKNNEITTDEYVRYNLYAQYDKSLLNKEYSRLKGSEDSIHIEDLVNKYYDELSEETLEYYARKINLDGVTFELDKENKKTDDKTSISDLLIDRVYAEGDKVTNLNKVVLSKNGNFVVWYTTTGNSATNYESAKKVADGLENTIDSYYDLFELKYEFESSILSKGKTYDNQIKILNSFGIDPSYLESAMQVYLVEFNDANALAHYVSGYGNKFTELFYNFFDGDADGSIVYPYISMKPSAFKDFERLEQLYNHELFHHYQRGILCKMCNYSDPYYLDSTANLASALVTNKTTTSGFLNEWASNYREYSNTLFSEYLENYGESNVAYAMFVYLYNYSKFVDDGLSKTTIGAYRDDFLKHLEDNSTVEERRNIQKEIALKNITMDYDNNNLNVPPGHRNSNYRKDTVNIHKKDFNMENVKLAKTGILYYRVTAFEGEKLKITVNSDNKYVDVFLIGQNENSDFILVDSSNTDNKQVVFDTNNYNEYDAFYIAVCNNKITSDNSFSISVKEIEKNENSTEVINNNYISLIDCNAYWNDEISKQIDTYYYDSEEKVNRWVKSIYVKDDDDAEGYYDNFLSNKNYTNVRMKDNLVIAEYTSEALDYYFPSMTRNSAINTHGSSCSLSCKDEECSWEHNPGFVVNYNPDSIN